MKLTPEGIERLRLVREIILAEPLKINMQEGVTKPKYATEHLNHPAQRVCDTVGCVAGWVYLTSTRKIWRDFVENPNALKLSWGDVRDEANQLLTGEETDHYADDSTFKTGDLFYVTRWPADMVQRLGKTKPGTLAYAQVIADRIDQFIAEYQ